MLLLHSLRPKWIPYLNDEKSEHYIRLLQNIKKAVEELIQNGYEYFISGLVLGGDVLFVRIVTRAESTINIWRVRVAPALPYGQKLSRGWGLADNLLCTKIGSTHNNN